MLGGKKSSTVSRYELGERHPDLATAILYHQIFDRELKELFSGLYADMRSVLAERVRALLQEVGKPNTAQAQYTRGKLEQLAKRLAKSAPRV